MFKGFESFIENTLEEAKQKEFIVLNRDNLPAEKVKGTDLGNGLYAYNNGAYMGWCLCDIASGTFIQGHFKTLVEVKDFVANMSQELKDKIEAARQTPEYAKACERVKVETEHAIEPLESFNFKDAMAALDEDFQEKLFK